MYKLSDKVTEKALMKAGGMVEQISGDVSQMMASEIQQDVIAYLLSQTRNGQQLMIDQPKNAKPSRLEAIKERLAASDDDDETDSDYTSLTPADVQRLARLAAQWQAVNEPVEAHANGNGNGTHPKA